MKTKLTKLNWLGREYIVEGAMERALKNPDTKHPEQKKDKVPNNNNYWTIDDIIYQGERISIDLSKELLDNKASKTQDEWMEYTKNNEFGVANAQLHYAIFKALYDKRNNLETGEIRNFLNNAVKNWICTSTRINYAADGQDKVTHDYNLPEQHEILEDIAGPDEYVKSSSTKQRYKALLGSDDLNEINNVFEWITGNVVYGWFVNKKPEQDTEKVAWFVANSGRALLDCLRDPLGSGVALGVRRAKI